MGGKGAAPQNNQMVQFEMQQAAEQRAKEERRAQRLKAGKADIGAMFYGTPIYEETRGRGPIDLSTFTPGAPGAQGGNFSIGDPNLIGGELLPIGDTGYQYRGSTFAPNPQNIGYEVYGPRGGKVGHGMSWDEAIAGVQGVEGDTVIRKDTGKRVARPGEKIFDDQFFNDYTQAQLDYNIPQVEDQFNKMQARTKHQLADAGLSVSSASSDALNDIQQQNVNARAGIINAADRATGDLRNSISSQYKQALSQLEAQEDPDVAATGVLGSVNNLLGSVPQLTPLGDLFKPLVIGAGSAYNAFQDVAGTSAGLNARPLNRDAGSISRT